jgi:hypothetical protein
MTKENIMTKTTKLANAPKPATVRFHKPISTVVKTTKKARLISLLSRESGADVPSISATFGWLPHTTRAALTGLRKAGFEITSLKPDKGKPLQYHIKPALKPTAKTDEFTKDRAGSGNVARDQIVETSKVEAAAEVPNDQ